MSQNYTNIMEQLQAPFKKDELEWRVGSTNKEKTKGLALTYVTNRAIQNRLDEVFGIFGWKNEYREWKGSSQICGISVWLEDRKEWITKWDGADDSNKDSTKGGLSDSMKRCAYQWGIGRYLYKLPQEWCKIVPFGKSYKLASYPKLPDWALPEGDKSNYQDTLTTPTTPTTKPKNNVSQQTQKKLSELQVRRMLKIGADNGYTEPEIKKIIKKKFNIDHKNELNRAQYDEICHGLESTPNPKTKATTSTTTNTTTTNTMTTNTTAINTPIAQATTN